MDNTFKKLLSEIDYAFANLDDSKAKQYIISSCKYFAIENGLNTDEEEVKTQEVYDYDEEGNLLGSHTEAVKEEFEPFIQD